MSLLDRTNRMTALVTGAVILGGAAILILMQFGTPPSKTEADDTQVTTHTNSLRAPEVQEDSIHSIGTFDPSGRGSMTGNVPIGTQHFVLEVPDENGKLAMRYQGDTMEPLAEGLVRIPNPKAWIYLSESRVMTLRADLGRIAMNETEPQSGDLIGNVYLAIYETVSADDDIYTLDTDAAQPLVEVTTDSVFFDRILNEIRTDDRMVVRTAQIAIAGRGFSAIYNQIDDRIERLKIDQRDIIFYRPLDTQNAQNDPIANSKRIINRGYGVNRMNNAAKRGLNIISRTPTMASLIAATTIATLVQPEMSSTDATLPQYYELKLSGEVIVQNGEGQNAVAAIGNLLVAHFSLEDQSWDGFVNADRINPFSTQITTQYHERHTNKQNNQINNYPHPVTSHFDSVLLAAIGLQPEQPSPTNLPIRDELFWSSIVYPLEGTSDIEPDDVLIWGDGPLIMIPIDETPEKIATTKDLNVYLEGDPLLLTSQSAVTYCGRIEFEQPSGEATILADQRGNPTQFVLNDGSILRSFAPVLIDTINGSARINGDGSLHAPANWGESNNSTHYISMDSDQNQPANPAHQLQNNTGPGTSELPTGIIASWTEGVELHFTQNDQETDFGRIESAEFRGDVRVDHSDGYSLFAESLVIGFMYDDIMQETILSSITGTGRVRVTGNDGEIEGDTLDVLFVTSKLDNQQVPATVVITGQVRATDTKQTLRCNLLQVDLITDNNLPGKEEGTFGNSIKHILAQRAVQLQLEDGAQAFGDRLDIDPINETATLTGDSVLVRRDTMQFLTTQMDIDLVEKSVYAPGAGTLVYLQDNSEQIENKKPASSPEEIWQEINKRFDRPGDETDNTKQIDPPANINTPADTNNIGNTNKSAKPAGDQTAAASNLPEAPTDTELFTTAISDEDNINAIRVKWNSSMTYADATGKAEFRGDVLAESMPSPMEHDSISCDRLLIELVPDKLPDQYIPLNTDHILETPEITPDLSNFGDGLSGSKRLRQLTAIGSTDTPAKIQAVRYQDANRTQLHTLLHISGTIIEYFDVIDKLEVRGDGKMLIIDARPIEDDKDLIDSSAPAPAVGFAGRGRTLFKWTGKLILDGAHGSMTILDDVLLRHRPDRGDGVDLWCQTLQATLDSTMGIDALAMSKSQKPIQLENALAEGRVFIKSPDREITANKLQYEAKSLLATIEGSEQIPVSVLKTGSPSALEAMKVIWDLYTNEIRIIRPSTLALPAR